MKRREPSIKVNNRKRNRKARVAQDAGPRAKHEWLPKRARAVCMCPDCVRKIIDGGGEAA